MAKPNLSIIIPTYNEEKYLPKLLKSIQRQKIDAEIIVADNHSKDRTRKIAAEYKAKIVNGGTPAVGRNAGAKAAKGKLLLFLDADAILPSKFLIRCLREFYKRRLDVATCFLKVKKGKRDKFLISAVNVYLFFSQLTRDPHSTGSFILCKKYIFNKLRGFSKSLKLAEDHHFVKRASHIANFGVLNKRIFFCARRLHKEGRIATIKKYWQVEKYRKQNGEIRSNAFEYDFGKF
jgi:glycosyltransferase involved in cell wall biosynthesis